MGNKVFQLAEKIKQDMNDLILDCINQQNTREYVQNCIINSNTILDDMQKLWDVNLEIYYTDLNF
jgi:hypothetical protein